MIRTLELLYYEERQRELDMCSLEKRQLQVSLQSHCGLSVLKRGLVKKMESDFLLRQIVIGQGRTVLYLKHTFQDT